VAADAEHLRVRPTRVNHLRNSICPYCRRDFTETEATKEHVVGRRLVPRGSLHQGWNLILRACQKCNRLKSALEDELSAVTMHPPLIGPADIDTAIAAVKLHQRTSGMSPDPDIESVDWDWRTTSGCRLRYIRP
jgi:hypothetical protein